ncbi:NAD(P)-binding protein [Bacillus tianshenii]|nr:NAD(P)-binding protein [Bacillus tianshenii]
MKIAIIGAGLSGLACAITLEKHGYFVDIFEKRGMVGDRFVVAETMSSMLHIPIDDGVKYFSEEHDIHLKPSSNIRKMYVYSPNESACFEGHLGSINMRGKHPHSYEKQLEAQLHTKIYFNEDVSYDDIAKEYTHIVLATGDPSYTQMLQSFDTAVKVSFKGALVKGNFEVTDIHTWHNHHYAPKGVSYFLPHCQTEGSLIIAYPQYPENEGVQKEELWKRFYDEACKKLGQNLHITETFSLNNFVIGKARYPRIGNTFFTGNCLGVMTPFQGFGQLPSIISGIYAAHDLCGLGKYEELTKGLFQNYHDSLTLRRAIEQLSNDQLDLLTKAFRLEFVERALVNHRINWFNVASRIIHPFSRNS